MSITADLVHIAFKHATAAELAKLVRALPDDVLLGLIGPGEKLHAAMVESFVAAPAVAPTVPAPASPKRGGLREKERAALEGGDRPGQTMNQRHRAAGEARAEEVLDLVRAAGAAGTSSSYVGDLLNISSNRARIHLRRLLGLGKVKKEGRGRGTRFYAT